MFEPAEISFQGTGSSLAKPQPMRVSVPLAIGQCLELPDLAVDYAGEFVPCQARVLHRWQDGSVQWCSIDWMHLASQEWTSRPRLVRCDAPTPANHIADELEWKSMPNGWQLTSPSATVCISVAIRCTLATGEILQATPQSLIRVFDGPICQRWQADLTFQSSGLPTKGLVGRFQVDQYRSQPIGICRIQLTNSLPAGHPNGNWDLGNDGSVLIADLSIEFSSTENFTRVQTRAEPEHEALKSKFRYHRRLPVPGTNQSVCFEVSFGSPYHLVFAGVGVFHGEVGDIGR